MPDEAKNKTTAPVKADHMSFNSNSSPEQFRKFLKLHAEILPMCLVVTVVTVNTFG